MTVDNKECCKEQTFEMRYWRKILVISWREYQTSESLLNELNTETHIMAKAALVKLQVYVERRSTGQLAPTVLQGTIDSKQYQNILKDNGFTISSSGRGKNIYNFRMVINWVYTLSHLPYALSRYISYEHISGI